MPRCRTAWLSLALSALGVACTHEAMRDHGSFAGYAAEMDERLAVGPAGDADPALAYWAEQLVATWPAARFLVVYREDDDALEALVRAAEGFEAELRAGWSGYLAAFKGACDRLRLLGGDRVRFMPAAALSSNDELLDVVEFLTGARPGATWGNRMQRLNVTSTIALDCRLASPVSAPVEIPNVSSLVNCDGLSAAMYRNVDFETVAGWWHAHNGATLAQAALPPLGVVVSHRGEQWAAVWCYECYGVPVAEVTFPATRPGLSLADASRAILYGISAVMTLAGKAHSPEASFRIFKAVAPPAMARILHRLGFVEHLTERVPLIKIH